MATPFDGISQQLDFTSGGEDGSSSSDNSSDDYALRICSPRVVSPRILNPESACTTPRVQRHCSRSNTISSPSQCTSPIPYATWRKLRLCDSPSTPKVRQHHFRWNRPVLRLDHHHFVASLHPCRACCPSPPSPAPAPRSAAVRGPCALSPLVPVSSTFLHLSTWIRSLQKQSAGEVSCSGGTISGEMMMKTMDEGTSCYVVSIFLPNEGFMNKKSYIVKQL